MGGHDHVFQELILLEFQITVLCIFITFDAKNTHGGKFQISQMMSGIVVALLHQSAGPKSTKQQQNNLLET